MNVVLSELGLWGGEGVQGGKIVHYVGVGTLEDEKGVTVGVYMVAAGGWFANRIYGMGVGWV